MMYSEWQDVSHVHLHTAVYWGLIITLYPYILTLDIVGNRSGRFDAITKCPTPRKGSVFVPALKLGYLWEMETSDEKMACIKCGHKDSTGSFY